MGIGVADAFTNLVGDALRPSARSWSEEALVRLLSRLLVTMVDGISLSWSEHRDDERFEAERRVCVEALRVYTSSIVAMPSAPQQVPEERTAETAGPGSSVPRGIDHVSLGQRANERGRRENPAALLVLEDPQRPR